MDSSSTKSVSSSSPDELHSSRGSKVKWILVSLVGIIFIVTAILAAILTVTILLDFEDQCFDQNGLLQQASYKLLATTTLYSTAFNYLNRPSSSSSVSFIPTNQHNNNQANNNNNHNYDRSSIELPKIFSTQETLESIHQRLTSPQFGCKVRQFHYFGRNGAKFPGFNEIEKINKHIQNVQSRIDLAKQPQQVKLSHQTGSSNQTRVCLDPLAQYKRRAAFASPEQANLLLETGALETQAIGQRFKAIFPEMFDNNQTKIVIGTTDELSTGQTALSFLRLFDNFALDFCGLQEFPSFFDEKSGKQEEIQLHRCFRKFLSKYTKEKLNFDKTCKDLHKEELSIRHNFDLKQANRTEFISISIAKKLKLSPEQQPTREEIQAIYDACRYESALTGSTSIWCNLFNERQLKFLEFLADIDDFYNQAYGHPDQSRSACPITLDLMRSLRSTTKSSGAQREAHFYFTHSEAIQKLLAASVDLEQDPEYAPKVLLDYLRRGHVPKSRQWQTSLFAPYSANLAFTLYSCPRASAGPTNVEDTMDLDVANTPFKVVATLNEQPILLDGCRDLVCDLFNLGYEGRINREKKCKLDEICKNNVVVT